MARIFISYRRDDSKNTAQKIHDKLAARFGTADVFRDVENIKAGDHWDSVLKREANRCKVMLVIIGQKWATLKNKDGTRRLDEDIDYVRMEIEIALRRPPGDVTIIPVLVNGQDRLPASAELPPTIRDLTKTQWQKVDGDSFDEDMQKLVSALPIRPQRRAPLIVVGLVLLALLIGVGVVLAGSADDTNDDEPAESNATTLVRPIEAEFRLPLTDVVRVDHLVTALAAQQTLLWGASASEGILVAIDPRDGNVILTKDLRADVGERFRPTSLHWSSQGILWVSDSADNQVIGFEMTDPLPSEADALDLTYRIAVDAVPVDIDTVGDVLIIALRDTQTLTIVRPSTAGAAEAVCGSRLSIPIDYVPHTFASDDTRSLWFTYQTEDGGGLVRLSLPGCQVSEALPLSTVPVSLAANGTSIWVATEASLLTVEADRLTEILVLESPVASIQADANGVWVFDEDQGEADYFDALAGEVVRRFDLDTPITATTRYGEQLWIVSEDNRLAQYVFPTYPVMNLVDVASGNDGQLWAATAQGDLCNVKVQDCSRLDLSGETPRFLHRREEGNRLWLITEADTLWSVTLDDMSVTEVLSLDETPQTVTFEGESAIWIANQDINLLARIDLVEQQRVDLVSGFVFPPEAMLHDGSLLWFGYGATRQQVVPFIYQDAQLIEQSPAIDVPSGVWALDQWQDQLVVLTESEVRLVNHFIEAEPFIQPIGISEDARHLASHDQQLWVVEPGRNGAIFEIEGEGE